MQVNSANELVLTELILENFLAEYEPEEIVALLSCFVFQEKTDVVPNITQRLERGKATILQVAKRLNDVQLHHQVLLSSDDDFESRPRFGLMEVVYEWAKGMSFSQITDLTDVLEGTIVRVITRLDETCREVKSAARIIGDPTLFEKMQTCQELIKRDVCHCASLYLVSPLHPTRFDGCFFVLTMVVVSKSEFVGGVVGWVFRYLVGFLYRYPRHREEAHVRNLSFLVHTVLYKTHTRRYEGIGALVESAFDFLLTPITRSLGVKGSAIAC